MLTARQAELLTIMTEGVRRTGSVPTYDQMRERMKLRSKAGIHRMICELEERGFVQRPEHRKRGIRLLRLPTRLGAVPQLDGLAIIPYRGFISTTSPMALMRDSGTTVVPRHMAEDGEHFAVRATGDGMFGLQEGDLCVIRSTSYGLSGDLVVVSNEGRSLLTRYMPGMDNITGRLTGMLRQY